MAELTTTGSSFQGFVQLTRWKEYVGFVIPLTVLGALMAVQQGGGVLDWRLIPVTLANVLVVAYAFIINDIEDAPDDALEESRRNRNPVSAGRISVRAGYASLVVVAILTLLLFAAGGPYVLFIGTITLIISHLYSWRRVRLKAWAVTDIVSHSLMLSGLLFLAGYFIYDNAPGVVWFAALGVTLFSSYGQLYNQLRDFDVDKEAGLKNTAVLLGESGARILMYVMVALAAGSLLLAIIGGAFPLWLGLVVVAAVALSLLFRPRKDFRGTEFVDASGAVQQQALLVFNAVAFSWLLVALVQQFSA
ncbi:MAG TPA: prenyltransferase [Candidatus Limnocylindrales bacterium]|nr:prenyltransferase [Candidatus Limnocylindrales bacterium]